MKRFFKWPKVRLTLPVATRSCLDSDVHRFLVQFRQEQGRLKAAAKAVEALDLKDQFPDAEYLWRQEALEAAIKKGRREAMVGLSVEDDRLHSRCVDGLLECGEVKLAVDLADTWGINIPETVRQSAEREGEAGFAEISPSKQRTHKGARNMLRLPEAYLCLPADVDIQVVSAEAALRPVHAAGAC
ncbi:EXD3 [Symbiodinium natans]|uniref:EXD3 protein n=1 Tax=Symbiodinium natans TaxID=878477 RepID=A0A812RJA0_9DINO|nr:EXD3 [Symbiodinium natans]